MNFDYDVLIVGGSHAGLSAAMALGRMSRSALIVDAGEPRNSASKHANNFTGADGLNPNELRNKAKTDLEKYDSISWAEAQVTKVVKKSHYFEIELEQGQAFIVRKVILAYGILDQLPSIKGLQDMWGDKVFHCPYCHGFEFKDKKIGLLGSEHVIEHMLPMMANLSQHILVFTQGDEQLAEDFIETLNIKITRINTPVMEVSEQQNGISARLTDQTEIELDALLVAPSIPFVMKSNIAEALACELTDLGLIKTFEMGATSIAGVYAAGDISSLQQSVAGAIASGQLAGSGAVFDLSQEDFVTQVAQTA